MPLKKITGKYQNYKLLLPGGSTASVISELLSQADSKADLHDRMIWLENILFWLKKDLRSEATLVRFRYLFQLLEQNPKWMENFRESVISIIRDCSFLKFFSQTGYTTERGLWSDILGRMLSRFLPASSEGDFQEIILHVFTNEEDVEWIRSIPNEVFFYFGEILTVEEDEEGKNSSWDSINSYISYIKEALLILSTTVAHHGLASEIRYRLNVGRSEDNTVASLPFLRLSSEIQDRFWWGWIHL